MLQLTQKERLYLQDAQSHEELCIAKYNHYAQKVSCQQLKQVLQWAGQQETTHLQSIQQLLQGQVPQMGGSQWAQQGQMPGQTGQSQQSGQTTSVNQILTQIQSSVSQGQGAGQQMQGTTASQTRFTGQGGLSDQQICTDIITTEKAINDFYGHAITETTNQQLRQVLNHIQKEEQDHAFAMYKYMEQKGWYQPQ